MEPSHRLGVAVLFGFRGKSLLCNEQWFLSHLSVSTSKDSTIELVKTHKNDGKNSSGK